MSRGTTSHAELVSTSGCKRPLNYTDESEEQPTKKQRSTTPKKRVRFGNESIHVVSRVPEVDVPNVWISAQEFYHSRRCDAHWIHYSTCGCDDRYRQELFQVLGAACGKMKPSAQPLVALADSPCRGLEREMTPCFRQRKKQVVTNVLQSQAALTAWKRANANHKDDDDDDDKGAAILASHYSKLALPATRFARLLAQGDALVVAKQR